MSIYNFKYHKFKCGIFILITNVFLYSRHVRRVAVEVTHLQSSLLYVGSINILCILCTQLIYLVVMQLKLCILELKNMGLFS